MKLESNFDFKSLRKNQNGVMRVYNLAAAAIERLNLPEEDQKTIEAILTKKFDADLGSVTKGEAPNITVKKPGKKKDASDAGVAPEAAGGGFV